MDLLVRNADENCLRAIENLLKDYDAELEMCDYELSEADAANLREIYEKNQRGELEFLTMEEFEADMDAFMADLARKHELKNADYIKQAV